MKKICIILLMSLLIPSAIFNIEDKKSTIKWRGTKSTGSYHEGLILVENSFINAKDNKITGGQININMNSITCTDIEDSQSNQYLIDHLKNDDFFSVDKFPNAYLTIVSIEYEKNNNYLIKADLKIKNETHPIEFIANIQINKNAAIATGKIEIDRSKYGIKYKSKTWYPDIGDRFINDIFELYFNLVAFPKS